MFPTRLPSPGVPPVDLANIIPQGLRILSVDDGILLIEDLPKFLSIELNCAVHIFRNVVFAPLQLRERGCPIRGTASRRDRYNVPSGLRIFVDPLPVGVAKATIGCYPVVSVILDSSEDQSCIRINSERLCDLFEVDRIDSGVGVHKAEEIVALL